ncbi:hypothetical protein MES5069_390078 [Mesorhizobium escarrei]|uniref:Uncharacterized protein n=1 Tax=Mesorhizobium escarrei TaxID=666018 RepID=A0ABN8JZZ2_9HYPH|nr:hypothetical protein MES5069_390078 [Mesorhizobium escarrei]
MKWKNYCITYPFSPYRDLEKEKRVLNTGRKALPASFPSLGRGQLQMDSLPDWSSHVMPSTSIYKTEYDSERKVLSV